MSLRRISVIATSAQTAPSIKLPRRARTYVALILGEPFPPWKVAQWHCTENRSEAPSSRTYDVRKRGHYQPVPSIHERISKGVLWFVNFIWSFKTSCILELFSTNFLLWAINKLCSAITRVNTTFFFARDCSVCEFSYYLVKPTGHSGTICFMCMCEQVGNPRANLKICNTKNPKRSILTSDQRLKKDMLNLAQFYKCSIFTSCAMNKLAHFTHSLLIWLIAGCY